MNKRVFFLGVVFFFMAMLFASEDPIFFDSGQRLSTGGTYQVRLGDLDGDGDLDAFVTAALGEGGCKVWFNDGKGLFSDSGQRLRPDLKFRHVALGDIDSDGDMDATATGDFDPAVIWFNDGKGFFTDSNQVIEHSDGNGLVLYDFDGDGDLDAFLTSSLFAHEINLLLNDGFGFFSRSEQHLWCGSAQGVAYGDLNGDGYTDVYVACYGPDKIFLNDGTGQFTFTGQDIGNSAGEDVALGDLDGDGDLDAFVVNELEQPNEVLLNDGSAFFTCIWISPGIFNSRAVTLKDLDGDGDLDAFVANYNQNDKVWLNNGDGTFVDSGQLFDRPESAGVDLGDLDGDGDIDAYMSKAGDDEVWFNQTGNYLKVSIDIKPGIEPNSINLGSNGNIPVVIFSTVDFDATTVDPLSITLAGASVKMKGKGTPMASSCDFNGDGILDLVVHIDTTALQLSLGDTEAVLTGKTIDALKIKGKDSVRIIR
jgi:hypothetical protein